MERDKLKKALGNFSRNRVFFVKILKKSFTSCSIELYSIIGG